jgi:hypothetical protein
MHAQLVGEVGQRWGDRCVAIDREGNTFPVRSRTPQILHGASTAVEIRNASGKVARGIEIELGGFGEMELFRAYYLNRHGSPGVVRADNSIRVRFESLWRTAAQTFSVTDFERAPMLVQRSQRSQPFVWEFSLYGAGASERFCLETSTRNVTASCRWLVATDFHQSTYAAEQDAIPFHDGRAGSGFQTQNAA